MVCKACYLCKQMKVNKNLYLLNKNLAYEETMEINKRNEGQWLGLGENWSVGGQGW